MLTAQHLLNPQYQGEIVHDEADENSEDSNYEVEDRKLKVYEGQFLLGRHGDKCQSVFKLLTNTIKFFKDYNGSIPAYLGGDFALCEVELENQTPVDVLLYDLESETLTDIEEE